jgi:hypothetical protein
LAWYHLDWWEDNPKNGYCEITNQESTYYVNRFRISASKRIIIVACVEADSRKEAWNKVKPVADAMKRDKVLS